MGQVKVNSDGFVYTVPSPTAGQAPVPQIAHFGEVITLDDDQERRGRETTVTRHYAFGTTTVPSAEPALVDVDHDETTSAAEAAKAARVRQLQAELAALDALSAPTLSDEEAAEALARAMEPTAEDEPDGGEVGPATPPSPPAPPAPPAAPVAKAPAAKRAAPRSSR